mmetsp:Transcript_102187/g.256171  ORF Transcript_102187/g.256171 Transcript_102187/m.256171 type:complete len:223 (-) Transcript_102187:320-988(-)
MTRAHIVCAVEVAQGVLAVVLPHLHGPMGKELRPVGFAGALRAHEGQVSQCIPCVPIDQLLRLGGAEDAVQVKGRHAVLSARLAGIICGASHRVLKNLVPEISNPDPGHQQLLVARPLLAGEDLGELPRDAIGGEASGVDRRHVAEEAFLVRLAGPNLARFAIDDLCSVSLCTSNPTKQVNILEAHRQADSILGLTADSPISRGARDVLVQLVLELCTVGLK